MEIAVILGAAFVVANPIISLLLVLIVAGYLIAAVCALPHGLVEAVRWIGTLRPRHFVLPVIVAGYFICMGLITTL
jgi:hypothetical protein